MQNETDKILNDAIRLLQSAATIADRKGKQTNWDAFGNATRGLVRQHQATVDASVYRERFEAWISRTPYFAHGEGQDIIRNGLKYGDVAVQSAWLAYIEAKAQFAPAQAPVTGYQLLPAQAPAAPE